MVLERASRAFGVGKMKSSLIEKAQKGGPGVRRGSKE